MTKIQTLFLSNTEKRSTGFSPIPLDSLISLNIPSADMDSSSLLLAGMNAKDYDISHIFIDSLLKIADDYDRDHLDEFCSHLKNSHSEPMLKSLSPSAQTVNDMTEESLRFLELLRLQSIF